MGAFTDSVPPQWRVHALFATFLAMIVIGHLSKRCGLMSTASVEGLRSFVFNVALPALLLVSTWRMTVTLELIIGVPWCIFLHCVWAALAYMVHAKQDPQTGEDDVCQFTSKVQIRWGGWG